MLSEKDTIDGAIRDFTMLRNHSPYRYGGKWFIAQTGTREFTAYRTKKTAQKRTIGNVWFLDFSADA